MKELGITKGEWNVGNEYYRHKVMVNNASIHIYHTAVTFDGVMITYDNAKANAELIADAGNTAQKCSLLPSDILRQRDRCLMTLRNCRETIEMLQREIPGEQLILRHEMASRLNDIETAIKSTEQ